ncbi:MAG TPA: helix-turn-helix transcriptional regulator [Polyangiaceae bacterium]|jgi:transcriptional regulator with XRE-family HTH domain|nr:helix-turn-helix transcriptional regulator [Polyangiaceae bacterium]
MSAPATPRTQKLMLQIGGNLQRLRLKRGWTQEHLAELTELDLSYAQRVERGEVNLTVGSLAVFADALGVEPSALLRAGKPPVIKRGRPKSKRATSRAQKR